MLMVQFVFIFNLATITFQKFSKERKIEKSLAQEVLQKSDILEPKIGGFKFFQPLLCLRHGRKVAV